MLRRSSAALSPESTGSGDHNRDVREVVEGRCAEGVRELVDAQVPSPVTQFIEGGRVCQTLDRAPKTLFDST